MWIFFSFRAFDSYLPNKVKNGVWSINKRNWFICTASEKCLNFLKSLWNFAVSAHYNKILHLFNFINIKGLERLQNYMCFSKMWCKFINKSTNIIKHVYRFSYLDTQHSQKKFCIYTIYGSAKRLVCVTYIISRNKILLCKLIFFDST